MAVVYNIYYTQYSRGEHKKNDKRRHMEIVVETFPDRRFATGIAYHITGNRDQWTFEAKAGVHYEHTSFCGKLLFGTIAADQRELQRLEAVLRSVELRPGDDRFNCQRWVWEASGVMRDANFNVTPVATWHQFLADMESKAYEDWNL